MNCYLCGQNLPYVPSWRSLFFNDIEPVICVKCKSGFEKIDGTVCRICGLSGKEECDDCAFWETTHYRSLIQSGKSLYSYNKAMQDYFHQFKFLQDVALSEVFAEDIHEALAKSKPVLVPIPMNAEKLKKRTFSQVECMLDAAKLSYRQFLTKSEEVQGEKSRAERMATTGLFQWNGREVPREIIIVDDLYTTGTTMRQAAQVLSSAGAEEISIFTLIRG